MTALSTASLAALGGKKSIFTNGGRWLALGDSITESGHYVTWMEYFFRCRTGGRITSWNGGVGGDTSKGALRRIDREIAIAKPSLVSVMFGMNDVNRGAFTPEAGREFLDAESARTRVRYAANLRALLDRIEVEGLQQEGEDWSFTVKLPRLPVVLSNQLGPESFLEDLRDKLGREISTPWLRAPIERRLENYPRLQANEESLLRRIEATEREIDALKFSGEIRCVLRKVLYRLRDEKSRQPCNRLEHRPRSLLGGMG